MMSVEGMPKGKHRTRGGMFPFAWGLFSVALVGAPAFAGPKGAHVHGEGKLGLAIDAPAKAGDPHLVHAAITLPADSLFGFERAPKSQKEWDLVTAEVARVQENAGSWMVFPAEQSCAVQSVTLTLPERFQKASTDKHSAHGATGQPETKAAEGHRGDDASKPVEKAGKKDHAHGGDHADIEIKLVYHCATNPQGGTLTFEGFASLAKLHKLSVQVVAEKLQIAGELSKKRPSLRLGQDG